jgi:RNA polymerase sigma-70 factor (ECF subfamily)
MSHEVNGSGAAARSSSATSRSLIDRLKANEPAAWDRLVRLYAPLVFHWCRRWHLQEEDMADILQEVFQAVVTHIEDFRLTRSQDTFRGWLRTIATNKVRDHFRRRSREPGGVGGSGAVQFLSGFPEPPPEEESSSTGDPAERSLFYQALNLIRAEFEDRTWQAFWRTTVDGRAPKDVGAELSMSPGAVRVAKSRVLHRLREELGDLRG